MSFGGFRLFGVWGFRVIWFCLLGFRVLRFKGLRVRGFRVFGFLGLGCLGLACFTTFAEDSAPCSPHFLPVSFPSLISALVIPRDLGFRAQQ